MKPWLGFTTKMDGFKLNLENMFAESKTLEDQIKNALEGLKFNK